MTRIANLVGVMKLLRGLLQAELEKGFALFVQLFLKSKMCIRDRVDAKPIR